LDRQLNADDVRSGARRAYAELRHRGRQALFFGHTHHARVWQKKWPDAPIVHLAGGRLELDLASVESVYFVNVGTTGRPFPGKGPASFTLFEDEPSGAWLETVVLWP
jgi:hypothetical protein